MARPHAVPPGDNAELGPQALDNEFRTRGAPGNINLRDGAVLLMFEKVNRGAQFAAKRGNKVFELRLNLRR